MSRLIKKQIKYISNVNIEILDKQLKICGELGILTIPFLNELKVHNNEKTKTILLQNPLNLVNSKYEGLYWSLLKNAIIGVSQGFEKLITLEGVGYKFQIENNNILVLNLGFSHKISIIIPNEIKYKLESQTTLKLLSNNLESLGNFSKIIQKYRKPEPYKGKGIFIDSEKIQRKIGKRGK